MLTSLKHIHLDVFFTRNDVARFSSIGCVKNEDVEGILNQVMNL